MREEYDRRRQLIVGGLNRLGLPTFEPHGAFYAFPNIAVTGMDDETFAQKLLEEERVAVVPGSLLRRRRRGLRALLLRHRLRTDRGSAAPHGTASCADMDKMFATGW